MKVSVIGCGNMGSAIVRSWIDSKLLKETDIKIFDRNSANKQILADTDFVLLAIKPQDLPAISTEYKIPDNTVIISILAGVRIEKLGSLFGRRTGIVRSMPNLAASVGHSVTAYVATRDIAADKLKLIDRLLAAFGSAHRFDSEELMDAWCALAGSGPGLIFDLMDKFYNAGCDLGFDPELSAQLVSEVFLGSSMLAAARQQAGSIGSGRPASSHDIFSMLAASVTSKGGTTEAALGVFEQSDLKNIIQKALLAAKSRSKELNSL